MRLSRRWCAAWTTPSCWRRSVMGPWPIATDSSTRIVPAATMPTSSFVISIAEASAGEYWLGTRDAGLVRVQGSRVTRVIDGLPDLKINCLLARANGRAVDRDGQGRRAMEWKRSHPGRDSGGTAGSARAGDGPGQRRERLDRRRVERVDACRSSGCRGGRRSGRGITPPRLGGLRGSRRNLWVGTDTGIERWRDPVFTTYSTAQGLPMDGVGPVYADESGRTWFAPIGGGLYWIHDGAVGRVSVAGSDRDVVYSIDGAGGEVWVGRQRGGVTRLRFSGASIEAEGVTHVSRPAASQRLRRQPRARWRGVGRHAERRRQPAERWRLHRVQRDGRPGLEHRGRDSRGGRWNDVVCDVERAERFLARRVEDLYAEGWPAIE